MQVKKAGEEYSIMFSYTSVRRTAFEKMLEGVLDAEN